MREKVVWGIGNYGKLCALHLGLNNVCFFIDSDKRKSGDFLGKKVVTPESVHDWKNIHIYIPFNYKKEISDKLKSLDVFSEAVVSVYGKNALITKERAEEEHKRAMEDLKEVDFEKYQNGILFWGVAWALGRDYSRGYIDLISSQNMFVVSEAYWVNREETEYILNNKAIVAPLYITNSINVKLSHSDDELKMDAWNDNAIKDLADSIVASGSKVSEKDAYYEACKTYSFMEAVLKKSNFRYAIINGSDVPEHRMLSRLCNRYGVKPVYTHPAVLPGTLHFDPSGDVGDSMISLYHNEFYKLPIEETDILNAKCILDYLYRSGINRKPQPKHDWLKEIESKIKPKRPTVFYAGQNDLACSMVPYTEESKIFQSPVFKSTFEGACFLAELCKKNDWNFVYKPHPMYIGLGSVGLPPNTIYVSSGDINEMVDFADVTVTIRSTTNYVALIRQRPVLMLGYTQSRGQGCTYEAFSKNCIEEQLKQAISKGFTYEQKHEFLRHVARLLKYYLYDDMSARKIRYGLKFPKDIESLFTLEGRLESIEIF